MFKALKRCGQSILEYAILVSVVSAAFLAMSLYAKRAIQGSLENIESRYTSRGAKAGVVDNTPEPPHYPG